MATKKAEVTVIDQEMPVTELEAEAIKACKSAGELFRRTVRAAWYAGQMLNAYKQHVDYGEWGKWLDDNGIHKDLASRYMRLGAAYTSDQINAFGTIDAAIKALPKPEGRKETGKDEKGKEELSRAERKLLEEQQLREQAQAAQERAEELERELKESKQVIEHLENEGKVADGKAPGKSKVEELQAEIRQLKSTVKQKDRIITDLKREATGQRQLIKRLTKKLNKLEGAQAKKEKEDPDAEFDVNAMPEDLEKATDEPDNDLQSYWDEFDANYNRETDSGDDDGEIVL